MPAYPSVTKALAVPDSLIGAVVGRGGSVIKDIMLQSGTKINVRLSVCLSVCPSVCLLVLTVGVGVSEG